LWETPWPRFFLAVGRVFALNLSVGKDTAVSMSHLVAQSGRRDAAVVLFVSCCMLVMMLFRSGDAFQKHCLTGDFLSNSYGCDTWIGDLS